MTVVSRTWRRFVIGHDLCKHLSLQMFPQLSRVDHVNKLGGSTKALEREHRAYAFLARCCLSTTVGDCISEATIASSTDNYLWENICNTLEPRDRVARTASYWSSKGQKNPVVPETLTYRLIADLYVVTEIKIRPFQAYFQFGYLIYSAKSVRFRMGHIKDADESCHDSGTDRFAWTYTSQEFEMAQENCLQTFKLPESCQDSGADRI
ncbi:hypothetical protein E1A91_A02G055900v1 [Gossypium mustelinum]|uniref:F-box domain-containing protein n=3 Tax=Gossypium TaxID=3633 RepID=A0A5J5WL43_GOSBA|nr:hypothetical protein ES319_A02G052800v1 [Gossypium barbadense]TYH27308.1 hypothetical protein ES288_A02G059200v1 [Gossypium darwinii]TYJ45443.1 hypothetical protein E1A91_A02G055900v1 [Gossypium mustelinum]